MENVTFSLEESTKELLVKITLNNDISKLDQKKIERALLASDFAGCLVTDGAIVTALLEAENKKNELFSADKEENAVKNPIIFSHVIGTANDASLSATISPDKMSASLELTVQQGGAALTQRDVLTCLEQHNIVKGIYKSAILELVDKSNTLKAGSKHSVTIASGTPCIDGANGYIQYLVEDIQERVLRPKKLEGGKVDMRELGDFVHVKKGTLLAKIIEPTLGTTGVTVTNDVLQPKAGDKATIKTSDGSDFSDETKTTLVAAIDGMPKHLEESVSVNKVLELDNVDVGCGNINFDGSVYIKGNVGEGMRVLASEDVVIGGLAESCEIVAGGNISIVQGIIGRQIDDEQGFGIRSIFLQADGSINALFAQYADILSKQDINIGQHVTHCQIQSGGNIYIGDMSKEKADGKLFGGFIDCGGALYTGELGSTSGGNTQISFDYWLEQLTEVTENLDLRLNKLTARCHKISQFLAALCAEENKDTDKIARVTNSLNQHLNALGVSFADYYQFCDNVDNHPNILELLAYESVHNGVSVEIQRHATQFRREHGPTRVSWHEAAILVEPIKD